MTEKGFYSLMAIHTDLQIPTIHPFTSGVQRQGVKQAYQRFRRTRRAENW